MKNFRLFVAFTLICFALSQRAQGVVPPPPGGYPNFTTAAGDHALQALTLGLGNTAIGTFSLFSVTTGNFNTAVGAGSLDLNTADSNTATGAAALLFNTTGTENTANGAAALEFNTSGGLNTANGAFALFNNTTGNFNTAIGAFALENNAGNENTAIGASALEVSTVGNNNTAIGKGALVANSTGDSNTGIGDRALESNTTGSGNVAVGNFAGFFATTGDNNVYIGAVGGLVGESDACYIASIAGQTSPDGVPVLINSDNKLGTNTSSKRFKKDIATMQKTSEAILSLRPVTFHYKTDTKGIPQFGLIAEEVAKVNPALVLPDKEGKPYTVRYDAVNAMLLNEFLKEHKTVQEQGATITELKTQIQALTTGLQKVSAQLEVSKGAPQVVGNQ
jgi:hypothetical protein